MNITIDTNIWVKAYCDKPRNYNCYSYINTFVESDNYLVVDYGHHILGEYNRYLETNEIFRMLMDQLEKRHMISFVSSDYSEKHKSKLKALGFHEEPDHIFVGVAYNSDKYIVSEDSDFGLGICAKASDACKKIIKEYMIEKMHFILRDSVNAKTDLCDSI